MKRILLLLLVFSQTALHAQSKLAFHPAGTFSFAETKSAAPASLSSDGGEADGVIRAILGVVGLKPNFEVRAADISNAAAVVYDGKRYILYDREFILSINRASSTSWAGISILAHEIGHHLNGHTLNSGGSNQKDELEADEFSGFVLRKLGATLEEAQAAMRMMREDYETATHPERNRRLKAIALGWHHAGDQQMALNSPAQGVQQKVHAPERKQPVQVLASQHILREVHFDHAPDRKLYITTDYNLVAVKNKQLVHYGKLRQTSNRKYPFVLTDDKSAVIYVAHDGYLFDADGDKIGFLQEHRGS